MKNVLDKFLYKLVSRKLLVFLSSTTFFSLGMMSAEQWLVITTAYIGLQSFSDTITRIKGGFETTQLTEKMNEITKMIKTIKGGEDDK